MWKTIFFRTIKKGEETMKNKGKLRLALSLVLAILMMTSLFQVALATDTIFIQPGSWVFVKLKTLTETGEQENILIDFPAKGEGGFLSQFDRERILLITVNPELEETLPPTHHYYRATSFFGRRINLDKLMTDIDAGETGLWSKIKSNSKEAGAWVWDKSQDFSQWLTDKYQEWGVIEFIENKGWGDKIRKFFGR